MAITRIQRNAYIYHQYMDEICSRIARIRRCVNEVRDGVDIYDQLFLLESSYLQMRFCCELLATALAVMHETKGITRSALKKWNAHDLMDSLSRLNPIFFPVPLHPTDLDETFTFIQPLEGPHLGKAGVCSIYNVLGSRYLHRCKPITTLSEAKKTYKPMELTLWCKLFETTLDTHAVRIEGHDDVLLAQLAFRPGTSSRIKLGSVSEDHPLQNFHSDITY